MVYYLLVSILLLSISYILAWRCPSVRPIAVAVSAVCCLMYMCWRATVIPFGSGVVPAFVGVILYVAEALGAITFLNLIFLFSGRYRIPSVGMPSETEAPHVDILICTYNEPVELLRITTAACLNLEYPQGKSRVWVCDDGNRDEVRDMCGWIGAGYISRRGNEHAKAGNINHALKQINGELFAVFDADMIPKRDFLMKTVPLFKDENLAFVQTPQVFYNGDSYQYGTNMAGLPNEQDFFMRDIQAARAAHRAVLHVGTNAVFRRSSVLDVGGYPTSSITEDMALGMLLQARGYDTLFVNEELAFGLSAATFEDLVLQRDRWCRGSLQVFRSHNPLLEHGLTAAQRVAYLDGLLYWFGSIQKMIFVLAPIFYLFTAISILDTTLSQLVIMYLPYAVGQLLAFRLFSGGKRSVLWSHFYEMAMAPHMCMSIVRECLGSKIAFRVTPKGPVAEGSGIQIATAAPHIVLIVLTAMSWIACISRVGAEGIGNGGIPINLAWSAYNMTALAVAAFIASRRHVARHSQRLKIETEEPVMLERDGGRQEAGKLLDISSTGLLVSLASPVPMAAGEHVRLSLRSVPCSCSVVDVNGSFVSLRFQDSSSCALRSLVMALQDSLRSYRDNLASAGF